MEKEYLSHLQNIDALESGLLGHFDSDGSYIIDDDVLKELIVCNKLIVSYKDDIITANATIGKYKLNFSVYIQYGEGGKKRAGLFVVEDGKHGLINKQLQTYVDSVILDDDGNFMQEIKKRFHLYAIDESEGIDMSNGNLKAILEKLETASKKYKVMIPVLYDADKEYVARMLVILKESGEHGRKLLDTFKDNVNGMGMSKIDPSYWRKVKIMLDYLLSQNEQLFDPFTLEKMKDIQKNYLNTYKNAKEPVQEASKPAAKKKGPAKKKGGDDGDEKKGGGKKGGKGGGDSGNSSKKDDKDKDKSGGGGKAVGESSPKKDKSPEYKAPITQTEIFGVMVENVMEKGKAPQKSPYAGKDMGMER